MTAVDPLRRAWAGLLRTFEPPVPTGVADFVTAVGSLAAWDGIADRSAPVTVLQAAAARIGSAAAGELHARAEADLAAAAAVGADITGPEGESWPDASLQGLAAVRPYDRGRTAAAPLAWYHRGSAWPRQAGHAISLIGARAATPYGIRVAGEWAAAAAADGFLVVSGAAFGIDGAAHRGALGAPGEAVTVAVMAAGIDRPYPAAHRALIETISRRGAVISEYPPAAVPARHRFLVRNRLIAALSAATVVIEAGRRSGSLNTATTAGALGRQVFAVPGPVTSAMSVGCHDLIVERRAELAAGWAEIAALLGPLTPAGPIHRPGERVTDGLDLFTARVYEALPARRPVSVDALATEAALSVPDTLAALARLEMAGMVERAGQGWACLPRPV